MEINEIALLEILRDMAAVLEQCVQDVDRLYGALSPDDPLHDRYIHDELPPNVVERLGSIRVLRQRLDAISQKLRDR